MAKKITFQPTDEHRTFLDELCQEAVPVEGKPRAVGRVLNELIRDAMNTRKSGPGKSKLMRLKQPA